jgi:putative polyhydroxyalkanoate system protein
VADIDIRRPHPLGLAGARAAAERMVEVLGKRFGLRGRWEGDVMHFERPGVAGSLSLAEKDLHLTVALGFLLKAMKGPIHSAVTEELDKLFATPRKDPPPR